MATIEKVKTKGKVIVCLEGNIGSGVNEFMEAIKHRERIMVFPEPVNIWTNYHGINLLRKSYENPKEYAFQFYVCNLITMLNRNVEIEKYLDVNNDKDIILFKRCFMSTSRVFIPKDLVTKNLTILESRLLLELSGILSSLHILPDIIIFFSARSKTCLDRIKTRNGEGGLKTLSLEGLDTLYNFYEERLDRNKRNMYDDIPVYILDGNKSTEEVVKEFDSKALPMIERTLKLLQKEEREKETGKKDGANFGKEIEEEVDDTRLDISRANKYERSNFWEYIPFLKRLKSFTTIF